ncbi:MAG: NAD(P)/FAD-dependent oxidoreductase [Clostridium sp.]|nr:NAD(P)/FAD-dependent oxidoreductase [Clostridium sp.]
MNERYDIAIVGSGPAGLSAALNAKIRNKKLIIFGNKNLSPKLEKAPEINNYLGFYGISGESLKQRFIHHIEKMNIKIKEERINAVYSLGDYFALMVNKKMYEAKALILATGIEYTKAIEGEKEFLGKGVGYCATCDAPLYRDKIVSIVAYNESGESDAKYVSEIAKMVNYIPMYRGSHELNYHTDNVNIIEDKPIKILGSDRVEKLVLKNHILNTDGVFLLKDSVSPGELVPGLKIVDKHIEVDRMMRTNIAGCFAAGDCTGIPYQFIKAAGEGNIAALSAVSYLDRLK